MELFFLIVGNMRGDDERKEELTQKIENKCCEGPCIHFRYIMINGVKYNVFKKTDCSS